MVGVPVIINHKNLNNKNVDDERVGVVNSVWYDNKDGWYWCDGIIWDETAQNLITDKNWSVSCSYDVKTADNKGGSENNIKYDMEFLDGVFTHLALVNNPRYERANIVFNSKTYNVDNADKEFVTVGEGDSAHAIPIEYLKKNTEKNKNKDKEIPGLGKIQEVFTHKDGSKQYKINGEWYAQRVIDDALKLDKYKKYTVQDIRKKIQDKKIDELKDIYEKYTSSDKADIFPNLFDRVAVGGNAPRDLWLEHNIKETINNSLTEQFTDLFFEALAEVILENKEQ